MREQNLRLICGGTEGSIQCLISFLPLKARGTSGLLDVVLPDGLWVQFSTELQLLGFFGQQEAGWQRPTSGDSFFNLRRYNTEQSVSPIMSLTSNLLDWWSLFPQK